MSNLNDEIRSLKEDIEELNVKIVKKSAASNRNDFDREDEFYQPYKTRSPKQGDYKAQIESKFREQKAIAELEARVQEAER